VALGGVTAARVRFEPGWKWSECIKPVVNTDLCQARHIGVVESGSLEITHSDGTVMVAGPGDIYVVEPGHDALVVGNEPFIAYEFDSKSASTYAKS
jgi:hypothetical protein